MSVVLITGASSGIGYATALAFAKAGWQVAGTARRTDRLNQLKTEIDALQAGAFLPIVVDVRDGAAMQQAAAQVVATFGRVDVLVANAGVGQRGSLADSDWEGIETLLRTNIDGVLHSVRAVVPAMRAQGGGHIILISSVAYNLTAPYAATYAASKAFVSSIGRSLRLELESDRINVTALLVGRTATEFSEKRLGQSGRSGGGIPLMPPEQVAQAILKASQGNRRTVALRWIDRVLLVANRWLPEIMGRLALRQYK
ncbi:MAG: SDR family oxidoreductase [Anaerolineae bacterium]